MKWVDDEVSSRKKSLVTMPAIRFQSTPYTLGACIIVRVPKAAGAKLPSRGLVLAEGTVNGTPFQGPLEPDGQGSHWLKLDKKSRVSVGEPAELVLEPMEMWPEPEVPADLKKAIATGGATVRQTWKDITPAARWDWIRWIRSTNNPATREKRIHVALSKMEAGDRRPCCFNRNQCTVPEVSKSGVLLAPTA